MAGKSVWLSRKILGKVLRNVDFTIASVYVALFVTLPSDAGAGGVEVSGTGYARQAATFTESDEDTSTNTNDLIYDAGGDWGTVVGFGLYDAVSGGNPLYLDQLVDAGGDPDPKTISAGERLTLPAGAVVIEES